MWVILLLISLGSAAVYSFMCVQAYMNGRKRGTNVVTRFVRDVDSNGRYRLMALFSLGTLLFLLLIGLICKAWWTALFQIVPIALSFYFQFKSNQDKERVKDARVVTKVAAKTGAVVAAGATAVTGNVAASAALLGAAKTMDMAAEAMTDVDAPPVHEGICQAILGAASFKNPELFLEAAKRAGLNVEGKDLTTVAQAVIKNAPKAMLAEMPETMSIEDKAMAVMSGTIIDGTYKEV